MVNNHKIASLLREYALGLTLLGENEFKTKAFDKAAEAVESAEVNLSLVSSSDISKISGIGKSSLDKITQIIATGTFNEYQELLNNIPLGIIKLMGIRGFSTSKLKMIWLQEGLTSLDEIKAALMNNSLEGKKGFTHKVLTELQKSIEFYEENKSSYRLDEAFNLANQIIKYLIKNNIVEQAEITGILRRSMPLINKIDILYIGNIDPDKLLEKIKVEFEIKSILEFHKTTQGNYYKDLFLNTGPTNWINSINIVSEKVNSEKDIFTENKIEYFTPEQRDLRINNPDLITYQDIKGCLHNHSTWSDGKNSIEEMVLACIERGLTYFGISDHSKSAGYANGLKVERIYQQIEEVKSIRHKYPDFTLFYGIESDILNTGALDYDDEVLKEFDFIVASVHSQLDMDIKTATARVIKAIENPFTNILGHPTGRLLGDRQGYPLDFLKIFDACKSNNVIIEINASPWRFDLDYSYYRQALDNGLMFSINPDAHAIHEIDEMKWGILQARKASLSVRDVLNTHTAEMVASIFKTKR